MHWQGGGGKYPDSPSKPTARAVASFLQAKARLPPAAVNSILERTVAAAMAGLTALQVKSVRWKGCGAHFLFTSVEWIEI